MINVSVIFAFGLLITLIVLKGFLQAKEYAVQRQLREEAAASGSNPTAP